MVSERGKGEGVVYMRTHTPQIYFSFLFPEKHG